MHFALLSLSLFSCFSSFFAALSLSLSSLSFFLLVELVFCDLVGGIIIVIIIIIISFIISSFCFKLNSPLSHPSFLCLLFVSSQQFFFVF